MYLLPKTVFVKVVSNNKETKLIAWRKWLWFNYGHAEYKLKRRTN